MGKKRKEKKKGRSACCEREGVRKGAWTAEEDKILVDFIAQNGHGTWRNLPKLAGLLRCGKSCRLRWTNYLRPDIKRGPFTPDEENQIINLHGMLGNKWAAIASHLPGRTDNDVKNFWNSHLRKRSHPPPPPLSSDYFLRLWNSNVGEAFRTNSQTLSLAKAESSREVVECKKEAEDEVSADEMMKLLLLDFPPGANDMGFMN